MANTSSTIQQFGPYTSVFQAGNYFFVSGQVGANAAKKAAPDVSAQAHQALQNLQDALQSVGLTMRHVVKTTVFLKNIDDFQAVNEVYQSYFEAPRPARSCLAVADLPKVADHELLVEIEAVAYKEPAA